MADITLTPTIVIGIGSSGLSVLNHLQNLLYEHFGDVENDFIWLLNIETEVNNLPQKTPAGQNIYYVPMSSRKGTTIQRETANLRDKDPVTWSWTEGIPWNAGFGVTGAGAGGMRAAGRIVLNAHAEHATNREIFNSALDRLIADIDKKRFDKPENYQNLQAKIHKDVAYPRNEKPQIRAYIVGTLTGGTGSGMFIDVAEDVCKRLDIQKDKWDPRLFGIFFIPPTGDTTRNGIEALPPKRANSFGALYELSKMKQDYLERRGEAVPYQMVYLLSPEYHHDRNFKSKTTLFEIAGEKVFIDSLGFMNKKIGWGIDKLQDNPDRFYGTFGVSSIKYPFHSILGYASNILTRRFLQRLIDKKYYKGEYESEGDVAYASTRLETETLRWLSERIAPASVIATKRGIFEDFKQDLPQGTSWEDDITRELNKFLDAPSDENMRNIAKHFRDGKYFQSIQRFKAGLFERLEKDIFDEMISKFRESNNLRYVLKYLEGMQLAIKKHDRLLEMEEIPRKIGDWKIRPQFVDVRKRHQSFSINKAVNQNKAVLEDLMLTIGDQLIGIQVREVYEQLMNTLAGWRKAIQEKIEKISSIHIDDLGKEVNSIEADLKDESKPIYRLFLYDNFEKDTDRLMEKTVGNAQWPPTLQDMEPHTNTEQILKTLVGESQSNDQGDLLFDMVMGIKLSIQGKCRGKLVDMLGEFRLADKFSGPAEDIIKNISKSTLRGFLKYDNSHFDHYRVNIISELEIKDINEIAQNIGISNVHYDYDEDGRGAYHHPTFKHAVYIYNEVFGLELSDLTDYDVMLNAFNTSQPRFRLCYNTSVDYTILSQGRYRTIKRLLDYVRTFWLKPMRDHAGNIVYDQVSHESIPMFDRRLSKGGIELHPAEPPRLVFEESPGTFLKVSLEVDDNQEIDRICSDAQIYYFFKSLVLLQPVLDENPDKNYVELTKLYARHWGDTHPIYGWKPKEMTETYRRFFGHSPDGQIFDFKHPEETIKFLRGDLRKILDANRNGESYVKDFEFK
ncbi:MAG: hypothetical protein KDH98_08535 [Calditrichaeota bacterium]|nr:hypothetical protein [Calditrichota bacterium]